MAPTISKEESTNVNIILPYEVVDEYQIESLGELRPRPVYEFFKRIFDIFFSIFALLISALPMLFVAAGIKCSSKGSIFFSQERLGLNSKPFKLIKFRSMDTDAEINGAQWSDGDNDPRIFSFGRILRRFRLDELPQFWCILKGDMSFVGPRPERECFYKEFELYIHGFSERLKVKPGLTGLAQVNGGYDLKPEEKIVYDIEYIKKRTIWLDIKIIFKTIKVVFSHEGAK